MKIHHSKIFQITQKILRAELYMQERSQVYLWHRLLIMQKVTLSGNVSSVLHVTL